LANPVATAPSAAAAGGDGGIGNENVPIQLAQCWFTGLAISDAKSKKKCFSSEIYGSNFIKQHLEAVMV